MPLALDEIPNLELTPEMETALLDKLADKATAYLSSAKGFVVKPKADYDTELSQRDEQTIRKALAGETGNFWTGAELAVEVMYGLKKPAGIKTKEWLTQLKEDGVLPLKPDDVKAKLKEIAEGKGGKEGGKDNPVENTLIKQLQQQLEETRKSQTEKETKAFTATVNRIINTDLRNANVMIDPSLKDAEKGAAKNKAIEDLTTLFKSVYEAKEDDNGVLYFTKRGTDTPLMNTASNEPMTPLEIVKANHRMFLTPDGHQQKGGGTGGSGTPKADGTYANVQEIWKAAAEKGLRTHSPEWKTFVNEEGKKINK